jgi:hypothetical protein
MAIDPQGWWNETVPEPDDRPIQKVFPVVMTSQFFHELMHEHELAVSGVATCPKEEMDTAYQMLNVSREALYRYLQSVERRAKVKRTHIKRF